MIKTIPNDFFKKREHEIKKIDSIFCENLYYLELIKKYILSEIVPDIILYDYEKAIKYNRMFTEDNPQVNKKDLWLIGASGQGDFWFLDNTDSILWCNHDFGEFKKQSCLNLEISFEKFLCLGFTLYDFEEKLDNTPDYFDSPDRQEDLKRAINCISDDLYEIYPYDYF
ncbi:hypothetical protein [Zophobihabitans entericus]|uniref:SMI1/KNR4 family protein n=1 Tax=Zophobihabitans entericus TaxID=1635327 RepID=A0A6G9ICJ1_9GAMM|nr:hypothetical protein [Zophobihabitans entericus]QIQ21424.1 hypothetical protein IPMB12_06815 [Zophobihabitans entericus]